MSPFVPGPRRVEGGLHVVLPGLQRLVRYPAGESSADFTQDGVPWVSKEGSKLAFRARVRYRLAPERLLDAHRAAGKPVEASIVRPALAEALEATSRGVASPGLGTEAFRAGVREALAAALDRRGVELVAFEAISDLPGGAAAREPAPRRDRNLLVVGLDGADWDKFKF